MTDAALGRVCDTSCNDSEAEMSGAANEATAATGTGALEMPRAPFERIIVGIDGSPESCEAARQAAILAEPHAGVMLISAWEAAPPIVGVVGVQYLAPADEDAGRAIAGRRLRDAHLDNHRLDSASDSIVHGLAWDVLVREAVAANATLIAVGSHGQNRIQGILAGSTTTEVLHKAPCSVLVARPATEPFPRHIVVGVDGSPESETAYAAARRLATRFDAELWPFVAQGAKGVDRRDVMPLVGYRFEAARGDPVDALVAASRHADLLVVGSRGLHGLRSLGSVSERVAHRARCSTLVVR
jgi:nucleotide-binding universal stress UspA family protein